MALEPSFGEGNGELPDPQSKKWYDPGGRGQDKPPDHPAPRL